MPHYDISVCKMIEEILGLLPEVFAPIDVIRRVQQKRPHALANTIRCHVYAATPNHPSNKWYKANCRPMFYYLGHGRFRHLRENESIEPAESEIHEDVEEEEAEESVEFTFSFEADLEAYLADHLDSLEKGLKLHERQYVTPAGRIDLLGKDREGNFVIIEVKAGSASDRTMGQLMRYIGAVQRLLSKDRPVRGIIVCETATTNLKYAAAAMNRVLIKEYQVQFSFTDADLQVDE